ncbi:MAG: ATP-binding protein [Silvanigrellaceae bacterium]
MATTHTLNLEAAFAQMEKLARNREQTSERSAAGTQSIIGNVEKSFSTRANASDDTTERCICGHHHLGIYLKNSGNRSEYSICPACDAQPRCEECQGTGQLRSFNVLTLRDEIIPGACSCRTGRKRADLLNRAQLPRRYQSASFEKLRIEHLGQNQGLISKLSDCRDRVMGFCEGAVPFLSGHEPAPDKIFLTLLGPVGTGKTLMGCAGLKWLVEETGCTARFVDFLFLLGQLRESYSQNSSEEKILKPLRDADVLLIDELGKGRAEKAWQMEKLDDLLNSRYNEGRITILTTNYLPPEAAYDPVRAGFRTAPANESFWEQSLPERIGARMYDRIVESSVFVDFIGLPSFRRATAEAFLQRHKAETTKGF